MRDDWINDFIRAAVETQKRYAVVWSYGRPRRFRLDGSGQANATIYRAIAHDVLVGVYDWRVRKEDLAADLEFMRERA